MAKQILPEGKYVIANLGPSSKWEMNGTPMVKYAIQLKGHADWFDLNQAEKTAAPTVDQELEGHAEQDDAGKYPPRFKKKSGGYGGGGGAASPGAIWSATYASAIAAVNGFLAVADDTKKAKAGASLDQYMTLVDLVADQIKKRVDAKAGTTETAKSTESKETPKTESESGESPATDGPEIVDMDVQDSDLKDW